MRGARVLLTPTERPYKSTGKTVGRFACRGFRPPPLAMDWGHGEAKPKYVSKRATIGAYFVVVVWVVVFVFVWGGGR